MTGLDREEFESWLKGQTQETCVKIAARAALRVFPFAVAFDGKADWQKPLALLTARAILTSVVAGTMPSPEVRAAAEAARVAVDAARAAAEIAHAATDVAYVLSTDIAAARAADAAGAGADAVRAASRADDAVRIALAPLVDLAADTLDAALAADTKTDPSRLFETPLWHQPGAPDWLTEALAGRPSLMETPEFAFWREWYHGFLDGKPLDWELQKEIALIPDADWEKGPARIAELIEETKAKFPPVPQDRTGDEPIEISKSEKSAIAQRVKLNREAIALTVAGLLEQIAQHSEYVRGLNNLEPEYRENLLAFLEKLSGKLKELLGELPDQDEDISDEKAGKLAVWSQKYQLKMRREFRTYTTPENAAKATVPAGIILLCTGVGAMVGGPAGAGVGSFVGKLISGEVKPGKAVDELLDGFEQPDNPS